MNLRHIPLTEIDPTDAEYRISLAEPDEGLRESLSNLGILHPPLLKKSSTGSTYQVICGFRRIACARQLGWNNIPAILQESIEAGPRECLLRNYRENRLLRELHVCEKARLIDKLVRLAGVSTDELLSTFLPELQLPANLRTLERLQRMNRWPETLQQSACAADLAPQPLMLLADRDPEDATAVIDLFCGFRWSLSRQKELLGYLVDIAATRSKPMKALVQEIIENDRSLDPRMPLAQRAEVIRRQLRRLRFPRLTGTEEKYRQLRHALRLGPEVSFQAPPDFEGDRYRVEFHFHTRREYLQILQQLQQVATTTEFDSLLDLL